MVLPLNYFNFSGFYYMLQSVTFFTFFTFFEVFRQGVSDPLETQPGLHLAWGWCQEVLSFSWLVLPLTGSCSSRDRSGDPYFVQP